ncbi:MAG: restriction endonuclease subunit S [Holophaga sp.]|nr:restriction endonuclease subunit S [Holophaga sp.]
MSTSQTSEWTRSFLGSLASYINGRAFGPADWGTQGLPIVRIEQMLNSKAESDFFSGTLDPANRIDTGDLVFSWSATLAIRQWDRGPAALNQHLFKVMPKNGVNARFLHHLIEFHIEELAGQSHGSTMRHIKRGDLADFPVLMPIEPEQARIAEVLDTLDEAIQGTEVLLGKLELAQQGLLLDSLESRVRSKAVPLAHYISGIDAGKSPDCPESPALAGEWGVLKVSAVVRSGFRQNENKAVLNPAHFNPVYEVRPGDLLITRANTYELIAQACVVSETPPRLMMCDKTLRLKPNAKATADFLWMALSTPTARRHIEINATGSSGTMKNITQGAIRSIPIPDMDRETQDTVTAQMSAITSRIQTETIALNKLKSLKFGFSSDLLTGRIRTRPQ